MNKKDRNRDELYFTIGEVAEKVGVVPATIRNWEKNQLFVAKRSDKGYRIYSVEDIQQLQKIKEYSIDRHMGVEAIRLLQADIEGVPTPPEVDKGAIISKKFIGENWKQNRLDKGYSLEQVASAVGISTSYLSKIENVQANVSFAVLEKLASFYDKDILYYEGKVKKEHRLVRKGEGEALVMDVDGIQVNSLIAQKRHTMSPMIYTIQPGSGRTDPDSHTGEEFVHLLEGQLDVIVAGEVYHMQPGDSLLFHSQDPHWWKNNGSRVVKVLWVHTPLVQH